MLRWTPLRAGGSNVSKIWSRSTAADVFSVGSVPPSGMASPSAPPSCRSTYRLATPDSDVWRMIARVPRRSGW
jgi:hypothetical protein